MIRSNEQMLLYFGAILTGIFFLFPYIWMILVSAKTAIMNPVKMFLTPWTAINYIKDLTEPMFYPTIINSIIVASFTTIIVLIVTIPAAYTLARYNFKGKLTILYVLLGLMFFPTVAIIGPLYNFEIFLRIYNSWNGLIAPYTALAIPWGIWVLTGYFKSLPKEIEEAAVLDGCSRFQILLNIIIPLSKFAIITAALIVFIMSWNEFILGFNLTLGNESRPVTVGVSTFEGIYETNIGQLTAAGIIASIIPSIMAIASYRLIIEGLTAGAVKK